MAEFFGNLERLFVELYTYRWLIGVGLVVTLAIVVSLGYRRGWHTAIWQRRRAVAIVSERVLAR